MDKLKILLDGAHTMCNQHFQRPKRTVYIIMPFLNIPNLCERQISGLQGQNVLYSLCMYAQLCSPRIQLGEFITNSSVMAHAVVLAIGFFTIS